jgi:hypothetical protein
MDYTSRIRDYKKDWSVWTRYLIPSVTFTFNGIVAVAMLKNTAGAALEELGSNWAVELLM